MGSSLKTAHHSTISESNVFKLNRHLLQFSIYRVFIFKVDLTSGCGENRVLVAGDAHVMLNQVDMLIHINITSS